MKLCALCERPADGARGWCKKHYNRWYLHGDATHPGWSDTTLEERFWSRVDRRGDSDCWEWTAGRDPNGYGQIALYGVKASAKAHRISYMIAWCMPAIPRGLGVLHSCDNPPCVNPAHLRLGTQKDNVRDMHLRGRANSARGEQSGGAKLDDATVAVIRARLACGGVSFRALGREHGVCQSTISAIANGRTWKK